MRGLLDGWQRVDFREVMERLRRAQSTAWRSTLQAAAHEAGRGVVRGLEGLDSSRGHGGDVVVAVLGDDVDASTVAAVISRGRKAEQEAVEDVLRGACRGDADTFHPWQGLRPPLLGLTDEAQLSAVFGAAVACVPRCCACVCACVAPPRV